MVRTVDGIGLVTPASIAVTAVRNAQPPVFSEPPERKREKRNDGTAIGVVTDDSVLVPRATNYENVVNQ